MSDGRRRDWCFTVFSDADSPPSFEKATYGVAGKETCPETGKFHWQGFAQFKSACTLSAAQKRLDIGEAHMEARKGTPTQAADYCKKDGDFVESGELVDNEKEGQGKRNDIIALRDAAMEARSVEDLHSNDAVVQCYAGHMKFAHEVMYYAKKKKTATWRDVRCEIYWGDTRTGKTRKVMEMGDVYKWTPCEPMWFDGYAGEKILLIDEFYGQVKIANMLEMMEGHQMRLPIKGGFTFAEWDKVYLTSNTDPKDWYPNVPEAVKKAFMARVGKVTRFSDPFPSG